ncbi:alpha/beta fold hydrolase [Fodinicola acaciae]|uniref:alpha/beta fold hydrolase n=1 Tax=Fodinicola acaciae TaxID=2681555 RepID=UPI0013D297F3|nr:alpha/beta fold hydrolase [Fodinicola acaciae]
MPLSSGDIADTLAATRKYTSSCGKNAGPVVGHMTTLNVATDLDLMRQAVGDRKLSYVGFSYGTLIGATYTNLFPDKVRALALDGPVDADRRTNDRIANKLDRANGFETALNGMLSACQAAGTACPLFGGSLTARQKFDRLRERLRGGPLPTGGTSVVTISSFTNGVISALYSLDRLKPLTAELRRVYDLSDAHRTPVRTKRGRTVLAQQHRQLLWCQLPRRADAARSGEISGAGRHLRDGEPRLRSLGGVQ